MEAHSNFRMKKRKKTQLIIKGNPQYVARMFRHLRKEHPSTKRRMRIK